MSSAKVRLAARAKSMSLETRIYLLHVIALIRPGSPVKTFEQPDPVTADLQSHTDEDFKLLVDEGRLQLDRQAAAINLNHGRATTLITVTLAEMVFLVTSSGAGFGEGPAVWLPWVAAVSLAGLALAGAVSVLIASAEYGHIDTAKLAEGPRPILPELARGYAGAVRQGTVTNDTRLTVLRDAAYLAVLSALCLVAFAATHEAHPSSPTCSAASATPCSGSTPTAPKPKPKTTTTPTRQPIPTPSRR